MNVSKSCYTLGVIFATAQLLSAQTVYNPIASRIVGQAILQQSGTITAAAPNLVEGRELFLPEAVAVDTSATPPILYVADTLNNRVMAWKNATAWQNGQPADLVIGQRDQYSTAPKGPGTDLTQGLYQPSGLAVDKNGNLYVADSGNNRIVRYPSPFQQTAQPLSIDLVLGQKDLSSRGANQGSSAGPTANTLNLNGQLVGLVFDSSGNLWVSDGVNNRVLRFPASALGTNVPFDPAADLVLGHSDYITSTLPTGFTALSKNGLNQPGALAFSPSGQLFVADSSNRVVVFVTPSTSGQPGSRIMGIPTATASNPNPAPISESTLRNPNGIFFIGDNPFVVDSGNSRILEYDPFSTWPAEPSGTNPPAGSAFSPPAKRVFGQSSFSAGTANSGLAQPTDISFSTPTAGVYVGTELILADSGNNRVLAIPFTNNLFLHASRVLGQVDFKYNSLNLIEGRELDLSDALHGTGGGVAVDTVSGTPHLYVADVFNNRVLCFNDARLVRPGEKADLVIGQPDFYTGVGNFPVGSPNSPTDSSLLLPEGVAVDASGNLWVADSGNGRVLRFPKPFDQPNTTLPKANLEIGQASFFSPRVTDASPQTMRAPYGIAFTAAGHLVVSDLGMNRVLLFKKPAGGDFTNGQAASNVIGQPDFISTGTNELKSPTGIAVDPSDRLYVADSGNNRIVVYPNVTTSGNDPAPSFSLLGSGTGDHFNGPQGVALDPHTSEVWVTDTGGARVVRFPDYDGLTISPVTNLQFSNPGPVAMTVDQYGNPIIAEGGANRIGFYYRAIGTNSGNAANYFFRFSPGMLASLFPSLQSTFGSATVANSQVPVPTTLGDVQVLVGGTPAPLIYVSPTQINFQIPNATPAGSTPVEIDVIKASTGQILATWLYRIDQYSPGLFTSDSTGRGQVAAVNEDGSINDSGHPAKSGSTISFYGTGYGFIPNLPPDGTPPTTAISTPTTPTVAVNQSLANVSYSGVAPGFIGLWQINVVVPANMPTGSVPVGINMNGALSTVDPANNRIFTTIYVKP